VLNRAARKGYEIEKPRMQLDSLQQRIVNELNENGISIVRFENLFSDKRFSEIQDLAETHLRKPRVQREIDEIEHGQMPSASKPFLVRPLGRPSLLDHKDAFVQTALSDRILRVACAYLGMFSRIEDIALWCNVPTDGPDSYSQRWHRDPDDKRQVKFFLYLRDVDLSTGPLSYIPGSHNEGRFSQVCPQTMTESYYPPEGEVERHFSPSQVMTYTGQAGTLVFCNTTGLHKGGHPTKRLRLIFTTAYTTNAGLLDPDNQHRYIIKGIHKENLDPAARFAISRALSR